MSKSHTWVLTTPPPQISLSARDNSYLTQLQRSPAAAASRLEARMPSDLVEQQKFVARAIRLGLWRNRFTNMFCRVLFCQEVRCGWARKTTIAAVDPQTLQDLQPCSSSCCPADTLIGNFMLKVDRCSMHAACCP